ncbi:MAG: hypothetical protein ACKOEC_03365, partial [Acidimicrobiia bacterium]
MLANSLRGRPPHPRGCGWPDGKEEFDIQPTLFYQWQRTLFENAHIAFDNGRKSKAVDDAKDLNIERR